MIQTREAVYILSQDELDALIRKAARAAAKEALAQAGTRSGEDLWDADRVGQYLGLSAWTVQYKMPAVGGFPKAIVLGDGPRAKRRWQAGDIKRFAERRSGV